MRRLAGRFGGLALTAILACVGAGCGKEEAAAPAPVQPMGAARAAKAAPEGLNQAPVIHSVSLNPPTLAPGVTLQARVDAEDPDGEAIRLDYTWKVNGDVVQEGRQASFEVPDLVRGDRVEVEVVATDGRGESESDYASLTLDNRPPMMTGVYLTPDNRVVRRGDVLTAVPDATDPDGDSLEYEYRWLMGDREVGHERTFDTSRLRRGDKLVAEVVASDGRQDSEPRRSREVELGNSPPHITGLPPMQNEGGTLHYAFEAEDADGDRNLRFSLVKGPQGMQMDAMTGELTWTPQASQAGKHTVEVAVKDGDGDGTSLTFEVTVSATTPDAPPAAAAPAEDDEGF